MQKSERKKLPILRNKLAHSRRHTELTEQHQIAHNGTLDTINIFFFVAAAELLLLFFKFLLLFTFVGCCFFLCCFVFILQLFWLHYYFQLLIYVELYIYCDQVLCLLRALLCVCTALFTFHGYIRDVEFVVFFRIRSMCAVRTFHYPAGSFMRIFCAASVEKCMFGWLFSCFQTKKDQISNEKKFFSTLNFFVLNVLCIYFFFAFIYINIFQRMIKNKSKIFGFCHGIK